MKKRLLLVACVFFLIVALFPQSAAADSSLSLELGQVHKSSSGEYSYPDAKVKGDGIQTIIISFMDTLQSGDKIIPGVALAGWNTPSGTDYATRILHSENSGANAAEVQSYIRSIKFTVAPGSTQTVHILLTTDRIKYDTYYNSESQHYYQYIPYTTGMLASERYWTTARTKACNMNFMGRSGYLANITSKSEDLFIKDVSNEVGWLGGTCLADKGYTGTDIPARADHWYWADGPESTIGDDGHKGEFYTRSEFSASNPDTIAASLAKGYYFNWYYDEDDYKEPNNSGDKGENALTTLPWGSGNATGFGTDSNGNRIHQGIDNYSWNDISYENQKENGKHSAKGYFVEYGDKIIGNNSSVIPSNCAAQTGAIPAFKVTFNLNGKGETSPSPLINIPTDETISSPTPDPSAASFEFKGWYKEADCINLFDFNNDTITANTTLFAKWENSPASGAVTGNGHNVDTGDSSNIFLALAISISALLIIVIEKLTRRRKGRCN